MCVLDALLCTECIVVTKSNELFTLMVVISNRGDIHEINSLRNLIEK